MHRRLLLEATATLGLASLTGLGGCASARLVPRADLKVEAATGLDDLALGRYVQSATSCSYCLDAGPTDAPAIVLIHGWPETSRAWRKQIAPLVAGGWRVVVPDLRGCGASELHARHVDYAQRAIAQDMVDILDGLGIERAVMVGHDWGSAVAWNFARHHPDRCRAVGSLCVPYATLELGIDHLSTLINRQIYPEAMFPAGQFEYVRFYQEHFGEAQRAFEANVEGFFKVVMRSGDPTQAGKPFPTAMVRKQGGWFGPGRPAPDVPLDTAILDRADLDAYVAAYRGSGFFGVNSLYLNDADNARFAGEAPSQVLQMPVLFLSGLNDFVNDSEFAPMTARMRAECRRLTVQTIASGHWMQHERAAEVNAALLQWLPGIG